MIYFFCVGTVLANFALFAVLHFSRKIIFGQGPPTRSCTLPWISPQICLDLACHYYALEATLATFSIVMLMLQVLCVCFIKFDSAPAVGTSVRLFWRVLFLRLTLLHRVLLLRFDSA